MGSFLLVIAVGGMWIVNLKRKAIRHRLLTAWLLLLLLSSASLFPSPSGYVAVTVLIVGPGKNAVQLRDRVVDTDSAVLLDALIARGMQMPENILLDAAGHDSPHVVARLIKLGTSVNAQFPPLNETPLHRAVERKQYENAGLLLRAGAKVDIPDLGSRTPLGLAIDMKDDRMLQILRRRDGKVTNAR
jgi:hypothetical protein